MSASSNNHTRTGVLLVNLGSPDAPTTAALRRYLAEFLGDPRVVEAPRWLWWFALHGVILRIRPPRSAKSYARIWMDDGSPMGSPLIAISHRQTEALRAKFANNDQVVVELAMRYGNPSIASALAKLQQAGVEQLVVLPLYPQYSATTTASVFDEVCRVLQQQRAIPGLVFIREYYRRDAYINAVASSIEQHWRDHGRAQKLLFSFHGIPQRYVDAGDPYAEQCKQTAERIAARLQLKTEQWMLVFQSRFGREPWLQPYCDKTLESLPQQGVKSVDVVSPGFAADCLETLEEIDMENREIFLRAGGEQFHYIAALNDRADHIDALLDIVRQHMPG